jgi:hypothetical protein
MVSAIESTIDQIRQPGMKRTCVRSPDRFQITNNAQTPAPPRGHSSKRFGAGNAWGLVTTALRARNQLTGVSSTWGFQRDSKRAAVSDVVNGDC